jgi:hypothetical protein
MQGIVGSASFIGIKRIPTIPLSAAERLADTVTG